MLKPILLQAEGLLLIKLLFRYVLVFKCIISSWDIRSELKSPKLELISR